jgi:hypothetical protein
MKINSNTNKEMHSVLTLKRDVTTMTRGLTFSSLERTLSKVTMNEGTIRLVSCNFVLCVPCVMHVGVHACLCMCHVHVLDNCVSRVLMCSC